MRSAPGDDWNIMALVFFLRSELYERLKLYSQSLLDIQESLNYCKRIQFESRKPEDDEETRDWILLLHFRRIKILSLMERQKEADIALDQGLKAAHDYFGENKCFKRYSSKEDGESGQTDPRSVQGWWFQMLKNARGVGTPTAPVIPTFTASDREDLERPIKSQRQQGKVRTDEKDNNKATDDGDGCDVNHLHNRKSRHDHDSWKRREIPLDRLCPNPVTVVVRSERRGRYTKIENTDQVPARQLIIGESPFVWYIKPELRDEFCNFCLQRFINQRVIGCNHCPSVIYCSQECRRSDWHHSHWAECGNSDLLTRLGYGETAVRALIRSGMFLAHESSSSASSVAEKETPNYDYHKADHHDEVIEIGNELKCSPDMINHEGEEGSGKRRKDYNNNESVSSSYEEFLQLTGHFPNRFVHQYWMIVGAVAITLLIQKLGITDVTKMNQVASRLAKHWTIMTTNCQKIYEESPDEDIWTVPRPTSNVGIGCGVYPKSFSFINHSCEPNSHPVFLGKQLFVVTNIPLVRGQEVTISYGPESSFGKLGYRQQYLLNYYKFLCRCPACKEDLKRTFLCPFCNAFLITFPFIKKFCIPCLTSFPA